MIEDREKTVSTHEGSETDMFDPVESVPKTPFKMPTQKEEDHTFL